MNKWDVILVAGFMSYFMIGGVILSYFAASCLKDQEIRKLNRYKAEDFFIIIYAFWPIVIYWELKSRCQKRTYQRLKAKFEGK